MHKELSLNTKLAIQKARLNWKKLREIASSFHVHINTVSRYVLMWSGEVLKRVAVRWIWMHDRAIYIWPEFEASFVIAKNGDKLRGEDNIRRLVDCSDEAFALYRR